jgi:uncharacterized protein (DUF433 family)
MERLTAQQIRERPAYSIGEAAGYLRMNEMTLQTWALGRDYPTIAGSKLWPPLFKIADRRGRRLSFINLVEANVLSALRRQHAVRVPKIRTALDYVRTSLKVKRPLCDEQFETNGVDLFVQRFGELINASQAGQLTLHETLLAALRWVEREHPSGIPVRLYATNPKDDGRSQFVAFDPAIAFGRPALVGSGAPVAVINERFRAGDSVHDLARDYGVEREAIEEAIRQAELLRAA